METERIQVAVRPRGGWEAVDLGFRMARHWWRPIFGAWVAIVLPVAIVLNTALYERPWLAAVLLWWLKPAFDRIPLYVLSEALFGNVPGVGATLRAFPRALRPGLVRSLTLMRLSPLRSFTLPVMQLEVLRGATRRERARLLIGRDSSVGVGLIFACLCFEWLVVVMGLLSLLWLLLPVEATIDFATLFSTLVSGGGEVWQGLLRNGILLLAMTAIEPFYVAAGFALYINRRVYLEGWDIDLVFRKLARRVAAAAESGLVAGVVLLAALLVGTPARALAADCAAARPEDARACIKLILDHEDFSTTERIEIWVPKLDVESAESTPSTTLSWGVGGFFAALFQTLVWVMLAVAVIVLISFALRQVWTERGPAEAGREPPEVLFGLDVRPESLPGDVVDAARARWADGDAIGALSLLYRGALVHLVNARGLAVSASATEGECTRLARGALERPLSESFERLTNAWLYCAYGERPPDEDAFAALCDSWQPHLGVSA